MSKLVEIWNSYTFPAAIMAVECCFTKDGVQYYFSLLEKKKGQVYLTESGKDLFPDTPPADIKAPVILLFTGKKILSRKINASPGEVGDALIRRALPNVPAEDLYFSISELENNENVVSAIRKDTVNMELEKFREAGYRIIDISIGGYAAWPLIAEGKEADIQWGYHQIDTGSKEITFAESPWEEEIDLLGERIKGVYALSFLTGLTFLAGQSFYYEGDPLTHPRTDWRYHRLYQKALLPGIASVFLILLISFGVYTYYFEKNNELEQLTAHYDDKLEEQNILKNAYDRKKLFLSINGSDRSAYAKMADEIAATVPRGLQLTQMAFNPLEKTLKQERLVRFERNTLIISGESDNYSSFRTWLRDLTEKEWVKKVEILGYQEKDSRHSADFSIKAETEL